MASLHRWACVRLDRIVLWMRMKLALASMSKCELNFRVPLKGKHLRIFNRKQNAFARSNMSLGAAQHIPHKSRSRKLLGWHSELHIWCGNEKGLVVQRMWHVIWGLLLPLHEGKIYGIRGKKLSRSHFVKNEWIWKLKLIFGKQPCVVVSWCSKATVEQKLEVVAGSSAFFFSMVTDQPAVECCLQRESAKLQRIPCQRSSYSGSAFLRANDTLSGLIL